MTDRIIRTRRRRHIAAGQIPKMVRDSICCAEYLPEHAPALPNASSSSVHAGRHLVPSFTPYASGGGGLASDLLQPTIAAASQRTTAIHLRKRESDAIRMVPGSSSGEPRDHDRIRWWRM